MKPSASYLPSSDEMQFFCRQRESFWLLPQALSMLAAAVLANTLTIGSSVHEPVVGCSILLSLAFSIKTYLRAYCGDPCQCHSFQIAMEPARVRQLFFLYMRLNCIDGKMFRDNARLIGLMKEGSYSSTFVEVTVSDVDDGTAHIIIRAVSVPIGAARIFSCCFNDFGTAWREADKMRYVLSAYAREGALLYT